MVLLWACLLVLAVHLFPPSSLRVLFRGGNRRRSAGPEAHRAVLAGADSEREECLEEKPWRQPVQRRLPGTRTALRGRRESRPYRGGRNVGEPFPQRTPPGWSRCTGGSGSICRQRVLGEPWPLESTAGPIAPRSRACVAGSRLPPNVRWEVSWFRRTPGGGTPPAGRRGTSCRTLPASALAFRAPLRRLVRSRPTRTETFRSRLRRTVRCDHGLLACPEERRPAGFSDPRRPAQGGPK